MFAILSCAGCTSDGLTTAEVDTDGDGVVSSSEANEAASQIAPDRLSNVVRCDAAGSSTGFASRAYTDQSYAPTRFTTSYRYESALQSENDSVETVTERIGDCPAQ